MARRSVTNKGDDDKRDDAPGEPEGQAAAGNRATFNRAWNFAADCRTQLHFEKGVEYDDVPDDALAIAKAEGWVGEPVAE